jgi:hypothetical protein
MRHLASLTLLASALALGAPAFANEPAPPVDPVPQAETKPTFEELDTNRDGQIAKAEVPVEHELNTLFANFDRDTDMQLSRIEFDEYSEEDEEEAE